MIRKAVEQDIIEIISMSEKFYAQTHYAKLIPANNAAVGALALMLIEQGSIFVAEVAGTVVGVLGFLCTPFMFNPELLGAYEIVWYIEEEFRSLGFGPKLLLAAEQEFKRVGINFIQMVDLPENTSGAGELYKRLDYSVSELSYTKVI